MGVQRALDALGARCQIAPADLLRELEAAGLSVCSEQQPKALRPCTDCASCQGPMQPEATAAVVASVLDVGGWGQVQHVPLRCRQARCALAGKRAWYNYTAVSSQRHVWCWRESDELEYFFVQAGWGVTSRWLRQFTQRMAVQFASFESEAAIHWRAARRAGQEALVPHRAKLKIKRAWYCWRAAWALDQL